MLLSIVSTIIGILKGVFGISIRTGGAGFSVSATGATGSVEIFWNGSNWVIRTSAGTTLAFQDTRIQMSGDGSTVTTAASFIVSNGGQVQARFAGNANVQLLSSRQMGWVASSTDIGGSANDAGFSRAAAKVVGVTDGVSAGGTLASIMLSPSALAANQNNYNPGVARNYRLVTDGGGARTITGLAVSQVDGQECHIINISAANTITLSNQSASSTDVNRFANVTGADIVLAANEIAHVIYDATTQRWRAAKL